MPPMGRSDLGRVSFPDAMPDGTLRDALLSQRSTATLPPQCRVRAQALAPPPPPSPQRRVAAAALGPPIELRGSLFVPHDRAAAGKGQFHTNT
eukprot:238238-Chlamydomonas_euryale.AAC.1